MLMSDNVEIIIAQGKFKMIEYLEGRLIEVDGNWQEVKNHYVQGRYGRINLMMHTVGMIEDFCRSSKENK
jgi:hypothetical protein